MEKIFLTSTLLVPMPKAESKYTFYWAGTMRSEVETVYIILFNSSNKADFQPMLHKDLRALMQLRRKGSREIGSLKHNGQPVEENIARMRNIKNQIRFIKKTLFELANDVYIKHPQQPLLDIVAKKMQTCLTPEKVIYISGVSRIEKV